MGVLAKGLFGSDEKEAFSIHQFFNPDIFLVRNLL
jgi:hypothetical protein